MKRKKLTPRAPRKRKTPRRKLLLAFFAPFASLA
jgi:hypothetical protein